MTQKQLRNSWMDLMHRTGIWEGTQNVCVLSEHHSAHICMCSPAWKHCKPHPLGVLWRRGRAPSPLFCQNPHPPGQVYSYFPSPEPICSVWESPSSPSSFLQPRGMEPVSVTVCHVPAASEEGSSLRGPTHLSWTTWPSPQHGLEPGSLQR